MTQREVAETIVAKLLSQLDNTPSSVDIVVVANAIHAYLPYLFSVSEIA